MCSDTNVLIQQWLDGLLPRFTDTPCGEKCWDTKLVTEARLAIEEIACIANEVGEYLSVDFDWKKGG